MGFLTRLRAVVDPWGVRADYMNARYPHRKFDRSTVKAMTLATRGYSEGRGGDIIRDRHGRVIGSQNVGPRTFIQQNASVMRREGTILARYNPHARQAVRQIVNSVLSNGININVTAKRNQALVQATFRRSFEETTELDTKRRMNFHMLSRFWLKTRLERGGVIIRTRPRKPEDKLGVPIALQTLSYDYLYDGPVPNDLKPGETFSNGIAFNALGEESAFYLYRVHPEDSMTGRTLANVSRVEKYDSSGLQQVIHWFEPFHEDDPIGMPRGCIVYDIITRKMDYDFSILDRKRIEAKRTNVLEADHSADPNDLPGRNTPTEWVDEDGVIHEGVPPSLPAPAVLPWPDAQDWANTHGNVAVDNGDVFVVPPGYKYKPHEVSNFQDHPEFSQGMLREIAIGFFAPEWLVTGDLRKLSFAGGELGLLYWQEDCKAECDDFIVNVFHPIARAWAVYGERAGMWQAKGITFSARQNLLPTRDKLKRIKEVVAMVNAGLMSREDAILEIGKDTIEEVNAKIEREVAWARERGIPLEPGLYAVAASGSAGASVIKETMTEALQETLPDLTQE